MILRPYPEYKTSGVPWLGEIPVHWEVRRFKYLVREVKMLRRARSSFSVLSQYLQV